MQSLNQAVNSAMHRTVAERDAIIADQANAYQFIYPRTNINVPAGGQTVQVPIVIGADADFLIRRILMSFTLPEEKIPSVKVMITDKGRGVKLTDDFVDVHLISTPGYLDAYLPFVGATEKVANSPSLYIPYKFTYFMRRTATLLLEFQNSDSNNDCIVNIAFDGTKIKPRG
jgi:hypothetical protein